MAYFAIGLPIAILIRLFAGVPLFWFIVIPITILTFIGIAKMDDESVLPSRKFKDGKSIDSLAMAKKYYEEYRRRDEKCDYKHFCEQCKFRVQSSTCTGNEPHSHGDLAPPSRVRGPR